MDVTRRFVKVVADIARVDLFRRAILCDTYCDNNILNRLSRTKCVILRRTTSISCVYVYAAIRAENIIRGYNNNNKIYRFGRSGVYILFVMICVRRARKYNINCTDVRCVVQCSGSGGSGGGGGSYSPMDGRRRHNRIRLDQPAAAVWACTVQTRKPPPYTVAMRFARATLFLYIPTDEDASANCTDAAATAAIEPTLAAALEWVGICELKMNESETMYGGIVILHYTRNGGNIEL